MNLNGSWTGKGLDKDGKILEFPATVPGCVHTDLISSGIIKDIYWRDNSLEIQWVEDRDFTYSRTFTVASPEKNAWLEFDGLDTYSEIYLNGKKIGETDDMHIPYAFCVDGVLETGENLLEVRFRSPIREVAGRPKRAAAFTAERLYTRRIQCSYSWDWVDRFVTMGIYRDVRLVFRKENELDSVYLYTKSINSFAAQMKLELTFRDLVPEKDWVSMEVTAPDGQVVFAKKRKILGNRENIYVMEEYMDIREPQLWYPNGYGEQPLYHLKVETVSGCTGEAISVKELNFGIRELMILQLPDLPGSDEEKICRRLQEKSYIKEVDHNKDTAGFIVVVNGVKIMCKGANWVPCEPFPSAETPDKIRQLLRLGAEGGFNMLRVWGGGIFEQDAFYEECDRLGILVTQDFLMACGTYPEEEGWFIEALKKETKAAALRLRNHTCLAWWSGDNENAVHGSENKTGFDGYLAATYGIAPVLKIYDPQRYFLPSSPYGGDEYCSTTRGTTHNTFYLGPIFEYLRESDFSDYRSFFSDFFARFSAEQAAFGLPFESTLRRFMTEEDIYGEDTSISEFHMKNNPALGEITLFDYVNLMAEKIFGTYQDGQDRIRKQQMLHCEWMRLTFEAHRRNKWFSSGLLYWMFNDCWPAANGWSIIDYYCAPKPAYYMFRRCAKPVIASVEECAGWLSVYVCNDSLEAVSGSGRLYLHDPVSGRDLISAHFNFDVPENSTVKVLKMQLDDVQSSASADDFGSEKNIWICDIESNLNQDRAFLVPKRFCDLDIDYGKIKVTAFSEQEITVTAEEFQPYVLLDVPCVLEENGFLLKKGETRTIQICRETD